MVEEARRETVAGAKIRDRFRKLAMYDAFELSMRDYTLKYALREKKLTEDPIKKKLSEFKDL